jgi:chaperonin GroES
MTHAVSKDVYLHNFNEYPNESGFAPVGKAVLVQLYEVEKTTASGIIIPDQAVNKTQMAEQRAVVVACGPLAWSDEPIARAQPGDRVLFSKYAGYQATGPADGKPYRFVNANDIFVKITHEDAGLAREYRGHDQHD